MRNLQRVVFREIIPLYRVSEMLECGHRFESEILLADPLIAKYRHCQQCSPVFQSSHTSTPRKKPSQSVLLEARGEAKGA
jgi:hypothetical protein